MRVMDRGEYMAVLQMECVYLHAKLQPFDKADTADDYHGLSLCLD
jgi:hypothetical protein